MLFEATFFRFVDSTTVAVRFDLRPGFDLLGQAQLSLGECVRDPHHRAEYQLVALWAV